MKVVNPRDKQTKIKRTNSWNKSINLSQQLTGGGGGGRDVNDDRFVANVVRRSGPRKTRLELDAAINSDEFSQSVTRFRQRHFCRFLRRRLDDEQIIVLDV